MRIVTLSLMIVALTTSVALAGFTVEVTRGPGFDPASLAKVVIVAAECHEALDCRRLEREVASELAKAEPKIQIVSGEPVYSELLRLGKERYGIDLREQISAALSAYAVLEVVAPHARPGMAAVKRSEVKLTLRLVRPTGEILFLGEGIGRPKNTISSPEKAGGEVAERVFAEVFRR